MYTSYTWQMIKHTDESVSLSETSILIKVIPCIYDILSLSQNVMLAQALQGPARTEAIGTDLRLHIQHSKSYCVK